MSEGTPEPESRAEHTRDPGLANERTALAWQRTALSLLAAALIMGRIAFTSLGPAALPGAVLAAALSAWVLVESRWRYAQPDGTRQRGRPRGGRAGAFLATAVLLLVLTEFAALVHEATG